TPFQPPPESLEWRCSPAQQTGDAVRLILGALIAVAMAVTSQLAAAQRYPEKSIRFIAPYAPGGSTDLLTRTLALKLTDSLGQPVVADNRRGAGGNISADIVAKS